MATEPTAGDPTTNLMITVVGLGPSHMGRVPGHVRDLVADDSRPVVLRTINHPAARQLAEMREVISCDDLYEAGDSFASVYEEIAKRVIGLADRGVIYAVPGSPRVGEFAVGIIERSGYQVDVVAAESFLDVVLSLVSYDPLDRGLRVINGHEIPRPLVLDSPTVFAHLDTPVVLADVLDAVSRVVADDAVATLISDAGGENQVLVNERIDDLPIDLAGLRTSLFVDAEPRGVVGAVNIMRRLRKECPWDREQTHQSLVKNLVEETHELVEAISRLETDDVDWVGLADVEDELGDVLLQVLFHAAIGEEVGAFDIDSVATVMSEKLVRRHPHVFGDVIATTADQVKSNWDTIKAAERGAQPDSLLDGVPQGMPALGRASKIQNRAAKVGFDWDSARQVLAKLNEEASELAGALDGNGDIEHEVGDLLFTVINLARHLEVDPEVSLRRATGRFESRFRSMEKTADLSQLSLDDLESLWTEAKRLEGDSQKT